MLIPACPQGSLAAVLLGMALSLVHSTARADRLLVLCPEEFQAALRPLVEHKIRTGFNATLMTLEEIQEIYPGTDLPEKIRRCIAACREALDVQYVLLAGDEGKFPVRWLARHVDHDAANVNYFFPSDLYYADLYDRRGEYHTWDENANGLHGEIVLSRTARSDPYSINLDHVDLYPDVAVGRVPAATLQELENYVAKVIQYEYWTAASAWFTNILLIAGDGRRCDPGIHFSEIQDTLGPGFYSRVFIQTNFTLPGGDPNDSPFRPCVCMPAEPMAEALARSHLQPGQIDLLMNATVWSATDEISSNEFDNLGFYVWHGHTQPDAMLDKANQQPDRFPLVFSGGCGDGDFAGIPPGDPGRFAVTRLPYLTTDGRDIEIVMDIYFVDGNATFSNRNECVIDGTLNPLQDLLDLYPDLRVYCDYGEPRRPEGIPHIVNPPAPAPLQSRRGSVARKMEDLLLQPAVPWFRRLQGWIAMVGATMGAGFPANGELASLFIRSYSDPHAAVAGRDAPLVGDLWRSMLHYWLDDWVFDDSGGFDFAGFLAKYNDDFNQWIDTYCAIGGLEDTAKFALFGDPSLRVGGVPGLVDTTPPTTVPPSTNWRNQLEIRLVAADAGAPPSGVRRFFHCIDGGVWQAGSLVSFPAAGTYMLGYAAEDFLYNAEVDRLTTVRIDTDPPLTQIRFDGELPGAEVGSAGLWRTPCFTDSVEITLESEDPGPSDRQSGLRRINYRIRWGHCSDPLPYREYTGPFTVSGGARIQMKAIDFFATDQAGNFESLKTATFAVGNSRVAGIQSEVLILSALRDLIAMRMHAALIDTLPPIKAVTWEFSMPNSGQWQPIGTATSGNDGWGVPWDTTKLLDGNYDVRMTVHGFPAKSARNDPLLHQEEFRATVCNIPPAAYRFELAGPASATPGETIEYEIQVENRSGIGWSNLQVACHTDQGAFDSVTPLDGGFMDPGDMPGWIVASLDPGKTWSGRFQATIHAEVPPGTVIRCQAQLQADQIALLLSRDPALAGTETSTDVAIPWANSDMVGTVCARSGQPLACTVSLQGPSNAQVRTDAGTGEFRFRDLPRGSFVLEAEAGPAYQDLQPLRKIELEGLGQTVTHDVILDAVDVIPPQVWIATDSVRLPDGSGLGMLAGQAVDPEPGSGVESVTVDIVRDRDGLYWSGTAWITAPVSLLAAGTTSWTFNCSALAPEDDYLLRVRARDAAGNVSGPIPVWTRQTMQPPGLTWPPDGETLSLPFQLSWQSRYDCHYFVQVSTDPEFLSLQKDLSHCQAATVPIGFLPDGTYFWRVRAANRRQGFPASPWSAARTFHVRSEMQITGFGLDPETGNLRFNWQGPSNAIYRIQHADQLPPLGVFKAITPAMPGQPEDNVATSAPPASLRGFYRIEGY